jgi:hypothetical protein
VITLENSVAGNCQPWARRTHGQIQVDLSIATVSERFNRSVKATESACVPALMQKA